MTTMRILTLLLGIVLIFIAVYAMNMNEVKAEQTKSASDVNAKEAKVEGPMTGLKTFGDSSLMHKAHNDPNWTRKSNDQDYQTGVIKTH